MPGYYYRLRKCFKFTGVLLLLTVSTRAIYEVVLGVLEFLGFADPQIQYYLMSHIYWLLPVTLGVSLVCLFRFKCSQCHKRTITINTQFCTNCNSQIFKPKVNNFGEPYFISEKKYTLDQSKIKKYIRIKQIFNLIWLPLGASLIVVTSYYPGTGLLLLCLISIIAPISTTPPKHLTTCPHTDCNKTINPTKHNFCPNCGGQLTPTFTDQPETETT